MNMIILLFMMAKMRYENETENGVRMFSVIEMLEVTLKRYNKAYCGANQFGAAGNLLKAYRIFT